MMNIGTGDREYVLQPDILLDMIRLNRKHGIMGEAFFYYEGLKKHNGVLGRTLADGPYAHPADIPGRNGKRRLSYPSH
jgi:hypothetical protein